MEYITTKEASAKWNISTTRITILANEGRIPGAQRLGKSWLIPANVTKPPERKANHSSLEKKKTTKNDSFSFPLYHFRPDWSYIREEQLTAQQRRLLSAENAVIECRFADACPIIESILDNPEDIIIEIGSLWNAGICYMSLNRHNDFSRIFIRLQMLLSEDFPHRDDLMIILDGLKTYVDTIDTSAQRDTFNIDIHDQCLPLTIIQIGFTQMSKEALTPGTADTTLLELLLRFLKNTGAVITVEMMHFYLLGIYSLRHNMEDAQKHANSAVQIAYENKFYLPLVTFYSYFATVLTSVLEQYPEEFKNHCNELISQYEKNFTGFLSSINKYDVISQLTTADYPYIFAILMGLPNTAIAEKLGVSEQTVKRRIEKICEKLGVNTKKKLKEYLHKYM